MRVYRFARETGDYIGAFDLDDSDRDPIDPDRYLVPGDATPLAPPAAPDGYRARFDGAAWQIAPLDPAVQWRALRARAIAALPACDRVALQCFKFGLSYPDEWRAFEIALSEIIATPDDAPLIAFPPAPLAPQIPFVRA